MTNALTLASHDRFVSLQAKAGAQNDNVYDIATLPFSPALVDAPFSADQLAVTSCRLVGFADLARQPSIDRLREPFQVLAELLYMPGQTSATVRIGVHEHDGHTNVHADLVVVTLGGVDAVDECHAIQAQIARHLSGPNAPFRISWKPIRELDWPLSGHGAFIRQPLMHIGEPDGGFDLPLRFSYPGPTAPQRLLDALCAAGPGTDLFISIVPTQLRGNELVTIDRMRRAATAEHERDGGFARESATALDLSLSSRTDLYVLQVLCVARQPLAAATLRAIGSSLTAGYDSERYVGYRIVSRPNRFVGGGFDVEPCRNPAQVLEWLQYGCPYVGLREDRELVDLATSTEVSWCFGWPTDNNGLLPGHSAAGNSAPNVPAAKGSVTLGIDAFGNAIRLLDEDRRLGTLAVGATGTGKTTMLTALALQDVRAGRGIFVIDPHGDLCARIAAGIPRRSHKKVFYLDADSGAFDAVDLLRLFAPSTPEQANVIRSLVDGMSADLTREMAGPVWRRVTETTLRLAALTGGSLLHVGELIRDRDSFEAYAEQTNDQLLIEFAREMQGWSPNYHADTVTWVASKLDWLAATPMANTFAALQPTFSFPDALNDGAVVLVNPGGGGNTDSAMSVLLEVFMTCVAHRPESAPTIGVYLDEVQRYCGSTLRRLANESRKRALAVHYATQGLTNVGSHVEALIGNAGTVIIGRCAGPTAGFAESHLGVRSEMMARLANLQAMARITVRGEPSEAFRLNVNPPSGKRTRLPPKWLCNATTYRRPF